MPIISCSLLEKEIKPLNTLLSRVICDISGIYMDFHKEHYGIPGCHIHDLLAIGVAIDPGFVEIEEFYVQVETPALRLPRRSALMIFRREESEPANFASTNLIAERPLPKQLRGMMSQARREWESATTRGS